MLEKSTNTGEYNKNIEKNGSGIKDPFKKYERRNGNVKIGKLIKDQKKRLKKYINSEKYSQILQGEYDFSDEAKNFKNSLSLDSDEYKKVIDGKIEINIKKQQGTVEIGGISYIIFNNGKNLISIIFDDLWGSELGEGNKKFDKKLVEGIGKDIDLAEKKLKTMGIKDKLFIRKLFEEELATIEDFKVTEKNKKILQKITNCYNLTNKIIDKTKKQSNLNNSIVKKSYQVLEQNIIDIPSVDVKNTVKQRQKNITNNNIHIIEIPKNIGGNKIGGSYRTINEQVSEDYYEVNDNRVYSSAIKEYLNTSKKMSLFDKLIGKKEKKIKAGDVVLIDPVTDFFTPIHEFAHKSVDGNFYLLKDTRKLLNSFLGPNEQTILDILSNKKNLSDKKITEYNNTIDYIFSLSEIYANIISLKYALDMFDIVDPMKEKITAKHVLLLLKKIEKLPKKSITRKSVNSILDFFIVTLGGKRIDSLKYNNKETNKIKKDLEMLMNNIADNNVNGKQNIFEG